MEMYFRTILLVAITVTLKVDGDANVPKFLPEESDFEILYHPDKIYVNVTPTTIAESWMVDRMTQIQKALVTVRRLLLKKMKLCAWLITRDIELKMPDYYFCAIVAYNNIIRRDYFKYPNGLISEIRTTKESLFTSLVEKIPIAAVDARTAKHLNFYLNEMGEELKTHGKLIWDLSETVIDYQETQLIEACHLPLGPREPEANLTRLDYLGEEDYEPLEYIGF